MDFGYVPGGSATLSDIVTGMGKQRGEAQAALLQPQQMQAEIAQRQAATQSQGIQNELSQQTLRDNGLIRQAYARIDSTQTPDQQRSAMLQDVIKNGGSAPGVIGFQKHLIGLQTDAVKLKQDQDANAHLNETFNNTKAANIVQAIRDAGPEGSSERIAAASQMAPQLQGIIPGFNASTFTPDDKTLNFHIGALGHLGSVLTQAKTAAETGKLGADTIKAGADTAKSQADTKKLLAEQPGIEADAAIKVNQANALKSFTPEAMSQMVGNAIDSGKYPEEYKRTLSAVQAARDSGMPMDKVLAAVKDGGDRIGHLEAGIAQAKATAPTKISIMQAGADARAAAATPNDAGLELMAEDALAGKAPSSRNPVLYSKVYERAAELAKTRGMDAQGTIMARNAAQAAKTSYTAITKQYETLKPFADMADKNADVLEREIGKVSNLGAPVLNTPVRELQSRFAGNPNVAAFTAALQPVQADFARILNSPTGAGVLSDHARKEMEGAISLGATPAQMKAALGIFRQDAQNRKDSYGASLADLKARTVSGGTGTPKADRSATQKLPTGHAVGDVVTVKGGKQIKITTIHPDGTFDGAPQ